MGRQGIGDIGESASKEHRTGRLDIQLGIRLHCCP